MTEELDLHLLKFTRAKREIPGCDFVSETFSYLSDSQRQSESGAVNYILEIDEDALGGFRS